MLALIALRFEETVFVRDPLAPCPARVLRNRGQRVRHPTFRAWTALLCCTCGGIFVVLAGSSFAYINVAGICPPGIHGRIFTAGYSQRVGGDAAIVAGRVRAGRAPALRSIGRGRHVP